MLPLMWLNCFCHKLKTPIGHKGVPIGFEMAEKKVFRQTFLIYNSRDVSTNSKKLQNQLENNITFAILPGPQLEKTMNAMFPIS